ncbi:transport protein Trs120 or TRAPPC9 TRAPP II complex subunit-domain-containing protein [Tuber borchii]|uniref:Transport protein Trs120 or TRAPPC9 TRAPP II complex subunit-domain-containing protein n=1 Tax=Tuber borchii TaxID=42251 RepID=A0A2T7A2K1_TUBBO|nr:transport protein Trs120 or TRAPPC9 TRAPP II complex subunit-domain-containing protein [Tuber borchii]
MPLIPYPTVEVTKTTKSSPSNSKPVTPLPDLGGVPDTALSTSLAKINELLGELLETILNLYTRSANFAGESIPQICFSETVIRFSKLRATTYITALCEALPIKRIFLQNPSHPIPSLSANQRQFVVSTTKVSVEQERQSRESFWYREEVLDCVRGCSEEISTGRPGGIELRGIRLSPRMVETICIEDIGVDVSVKQVEEQVRKIGPAKYLVVTDNFLTLVTTLTNRTTRTVIPLLRFLRALRNQGANCEVAMDLMRRFSFNGLLQQSLRPLEAGEVRVVKIGFVVLCTSKGEFEINASVEEVRRGGSGRDGADGDGHEGVLGPDGISIDVIAKIIGKKTWVSREMCVVVARDLE